MSKPLTRLGIVDWGIGGIGIYRAIKARLGAVPVIYFSDTGAKPYGKMSRLELTARLNSVMAFLQTRGVTHLIFGCNAASTVIPHLSPGALHIEGMIEVAVQAAVKVTGTRRPGSLAVIGGGRTVRSGAYRKALGQRGIKVEQRIAQPLSGLIESGDLDSDELRRQCRRILAPIKNHSHILLACTHYPAVQSVLQEFVSVETRFIDPAEEIVDRVHARWRLSRGGPDIFLTSGSPEAMKAAAFKAFDVKIKHAQKVTLRAVGC